MEFVCPQCKHRWNGGDSPGPAVCPVCHGTFDSSEAAAEFVETEEQELVSDLRRAFDLSSAIIGGEQPLGLTPKNPESPIDRPSASACPSRIGEFEVLGEIGRGGMGVVYRARQPSLDRDVAVKVLPGNARRGATVRRFRTEARAVARLNHPNVVPVFAEGEFDNQYYFAMALVEGCGLDVAMQSKPELLSSSGRSRSSAVTTAREEPGQRSEPSPAAPATAGEGDRPAARSIEDFRHLARLMADVADGLAHAHAQGVIHRDIKPQNLLLSVDGRIYITDFGLSHLMDEPHLTITGELMGTPAYLSPEQVQGDPKAIDHRTDIYSLGVTLYQVLTSRCPFTGETREQILTGIRTREPLPPRRYDRRIPRDLETICLRAIDKDRGRRFPTAAAMADDLRRFAEDRTILSRPPGLARRVSRALRRHRGGMVFVGLLILAATTAGGFAFTTVASRGREAEQLLHSAYDQLVYFDFREPQLVTDKIDEAERLGADPSELNLVRAIASIGANQHADALQRLRDLQTEAPEDIRTLYLLAWAQWRLHDVGGSRATFDNAEALGGPRSADEWFFRAVGAHFDRPELAIESYRQANLLRAVDAQFFPQAILHLARAHNQHMYALRSADALPEAESILLQLVKQGYYKAYPHYLLSISHRLAGEIAEAAEDPAVSARADGHFLSALYWARLGQNVDPSDYWPITAEAECLERLGQFEDAVAARSRAIDVTSQQARRCEGYHYRWRLNYWLGAYEAALQDIATHAACIPDSLFYAHVYPAWVYAEAEDPVRAAVDCLAVAGGAPNEANAVLWSATCLRVLGRDAEADALLAERADQVRYDSGLVPPQSESWMRALYEMAMRRRALEEILVLAEGAEQPRKLRAEAFFHAAVQSLSAGRRAEAEQRLTAAQQSYDSELRYTFHARTLLTMMQGDPGWPAWMPANRGQNASSRMTSD